MARKRGRAKAQASGGAAPPAPETAGTAPTGPGLIAVLLVFAGHCALYVGTAYPSVPGGDSGELISVAHVLGVAHPPGYPLFTMLTKAATVLVPVGSVAWRANVLSAVVASAGGTLAFVCGVLLTGQYASGALVVAMFSLSRLTWMYSVAAEVFAFNNCFIALIAYVLIKFAQADTPGTRLAWANAGALVAGLALSNQHTAVLYLVVIIPWVLWSARDQLLAPKPILVLGLLFALGLSPYAYVPLRALQREAPLTWGDQRTVDGFFTHLLRREYGTFDLAKGDQNTPFSAALYAHLSSFVAETHLMSVFTAVGLLAPWPTASAATKGPILAMLAFYLGFFNWRANLDLENPLLAGVQERFWMQPNFVFALIAACGMSFVRRQVGGSKGLFLSAAVVLCAVQIATNFQARDESDNTAVRDFGVALLQHLPKGAILLTLGDLPGNAARYVHYCDGVRPDLHLVDLEMATMDWYHPMTAHAVPEVVFPGRLKTYRIGEGYYDMKAFFDANLDRHAIFVFQNLNEDDASWQCCYKVQPYGLAYRIVRKESVMDQAFVDGAIRNVPTMALPDSTKYDERTWERVVHDGVLASGIHLALLFERTSKTEADPERAKMLSRASVAVYKLMIERYPSHPGWWYKNFGLSASLLFQQSGDAEAGQTAIDAWTIYMRRHPEDSQNGAIRQTMASMQQALQAAPGS